MDINELHKAFEIDAAGLGDHKLMTKTQLANGYCDADEAAEAARADGNMKLAEAKEILRSKYFSALMLRYWYKIFEWATNSSSLHLELSDFVEWLSQSLYVAFYYRMWRYEYKAVVKEGRFIEWQVDENGDRIANPYYNDPDAPDKIINRCCGSMRGRQYQFYNHDKRKAGVQTYSIDAMVEDTGDAALNYTDCTDCGVDDNEGIKCLIATLLKRHEFIEALIVDGIAHHNTYKTVKTKTKITDEANVEHTVTHSSDKFDPRKLVKHLNSINQNFLQQFCDIYSVDKENIDPMYSKLKETANNSFYRYIKKTLIEIKSNPKLLSCLYN